jgi:hypothetical protein
VSDFISYALVVLLFFTFPPVATFSHFSYAAVWIAFHKSTINPDETVRETIESQGSRAATVDFIADSGLLWMAWFSHETP